MPNIREFQTPALGLRANETGVEATAAAARRVGAEYNEAGGSIAAGGAAIGQSIKIAGDLYDDHLTHQEISRGGLALAGMMGKKTEDWNTAAKGADPNDPTVANKFLQESLEPDLEKFKEGFTTQRSQQWAESHVDAFRQHMFVKTSADMASLAGEAIKANYRQTTNSLANTVRNDPTSLDFVLKTYEDTLTSVVGTSTNLKGADAGRIKTELLQKGKEELVKSAALGHIEATGKMPPWSTDPKYSPYITPSELKQLEVAERHYATLNRSEQRAAEQDADRKARVQLHSDMNALELSLYDDDGNLVASKDHIQKFREIVRANPVGANLEPGRVSGMFNGLTRMIDRQNRVKASLDDDATRQDLTNRLFDPDNPTTMLQIGLAVNDGKLSQRSSKNLGAIVKAEETSIKDPVMKVTMGGAKQLLGTDPVGAGNYASFVQVFLPQYIAQKRAGTLPANALDLKDPKSLISESMAPYKRTLQQQMQDRILRGDFGLEPAMQPQLQPPRSQPRASTHPSIPETLRENPNVAWSPSKGRFYDVRTRQSWDKDGKEFK
ncbi:MAG TPA: hypothetical protein VF901_21870 [Bradyrhizobium sp.]